MASLQGKWTFKAYENIDAFLDAIAAPEEIRQKALAVKPDVTISQNGDQWTISTTFGDKSSDVVFKLGEEFDHQNMMGKIIKNKITLDGDKLVEQHTGEGEPITVVRESSGDDMTATLTAKGVSAVVRFQKA